MPEQHRFTVEDSAYTAEEDTRGKSRAERRKSIFVDRLLNDELVFSPIPPGAGRGKFRLTNPREDIPVDIRDEVEREVWRALADGALPRSVIPEILRDVRLKIRTEVAARDPIVRTSEDVLVVENARERLGLCATRVARGVHDALLATSSPFKEFHILLTDRAKVALALGWEAIARLGKYPLPPFGLRRLRGVDAKPAGAFHFVSASDSDAGYYYTMGIALSPEAQAVRSTNVSFGLDGELIVPGQAVSPIPPLLGLATRLFSAGIMTSSNISEEQHSIPIRAFPQPDNYTDLKPIRPGLNTYVPRKPGDVGEAIKTVVTQLQRNSGRYQVDAVIDVTALTPQAARTFASRVLRSAEVKKSNADSNARQLGERRRTLKERVALFYNVGYTTEKERTRLVEQAIDLTKELGLRFLAVTDDVEDSWLPGLHEYFPYYQMNDLMRFADKRGVTIVDGRPVDPMYTSSTALQRIQSVKTTLAVDILKLGMWLTLDAKTAEAVWREIRANPAMSRSMCLMPIGIVEPWSAFVDDRDASRNARAVITPFSKIKFMIEEAERLGMPSLLTDTRHKAHWVLLGSKGGDFPKHPREGNGTTSLLSWAEFMECERRARKAKILLGQAGSIEVSQIFRIMSETTYDAARSAENPATAMWTAETERVLRSPYVRLAGETLQAERSADVDPYLAVVNRIYESHAKMDGWLRFLAARQRKDTKARRRIVQLQEALLDLKKKTESSQDGLLRVLSNGKRDVSKLARAWNRCRSAFTEYHDAVRAEFSPTQKLVVMEWAAMRQRRSKRTARSAKRIPQKKPKPTPSYPLTNRYAVLRDRQAPRPRSR
jgi:hypothetical protein